ncbi:MAG TPA: hypothetical protein VG366_04450 [Solirubrobacteraceae bacterium]|nr:hypothetical protein [Solirubrobacteraceae bacterium]
MSDAFQSAAGARASAAGEVEEEILDGVPVLADEQPLVRRGDGASSALERHAGLVIPAVQAAAMAAGGFAAGAAVVGLVHRRQRRAMLPAKAGRRGKLARRGGRRSGRAGELVQIVGSRSLLVDVHLLGGADAGR